MLGTLLIVLCDSPFQYESADQVYEIAQAALRRGHKVNIFIMMDGVYNPITSQSGKPLKMSTVSEKFADLIDKGVKITSCRVCMELRGVEEKMFPNGLDIGGIFDFSDMIANSDVVINFI